MNESQNAMGFQMASYHLHFSDLLDIMCSDHCGTLSFCFLCLIWCLLLLNGFYSLSNATCSFPYLNCWQKIHSLNLWSRYLDGQGLENSLVIIRVLVWEGESLVTNQTNAQVMVTLCFETFLYPFANPNFHRTKLKNFSVITLHEWDIHIHLFSY